MGEHQRGETIGTYTEATEKEASQAIAVVLKVFRETDWRENRRLRASGFSPVSVGGIDKSIRIEVGGDLHEFGGLGKLVPVEEAKAAL
jgi:hypothetical protein